MIVPTISLRIKYLSDFELETMLRHYNKIVEQTEKELEKRKKKLQVLKGRKANENPNRS
jgi:hypothetical protein